MSIAQPANDPLPQSAAAAAANDTPHPADVHAARLAAGHACLEAALWFRGQGIAPTCCCDPDHIGVYKEHAQDCTSMGKQPMHKWKALQTSVPTAQEVRDHWRRYPVGNIGLVLGQHSGLVRIDVDGTGGATLLQQWSAGDLPPTWGFTSGSGGHGWLYGWPHDLACKTTTISGTGPHEECRLMAEGSQTVVPPSRHPSGGAYTWLPGCSPQEIALAPAPAWLLARLSPPVTARPPRSSRGPRTANHDRVLDALATFPNDDASYDDWLLIGMALHHTEEPWAREAWDQWSAGSAKFNAAKQDKSWGSFGASAQVVTLGSLFHLASPEGRQPLRTIPNMTVPRVHGELAAGLRRTAPHGLKRLTPTTQEREERP